MKTTQKLGFDNIPTLDMVDYKIRKMGIFWGSLKDIKIGYESGGYTLTMTAENPRTTEEVEDMEDLMIARGLI